MTLAYSRTAQAVFNTSFTTAMAFLATAHSPVMPISTFGIYAALCVVINYIMVITLTPTAVLVYEVYVQKWKGCCGFLDCFCCPCSAKPKTEEKIQAGGGGAAKKEASRSGIVEKFFDKAYIPLFAGGSGGKIKAVVSVVICLAWGVFSGR
jgi:hypothetical protein